MNIETSVRKNKNIYGCVKIGTLSLWIVKFRSDELENAAHLPTLDNGVEALPSLMVYVPTECRLYGYFGNDCRFSLYIRLRPLGLLLLNLRAVILIVFRR